MLFWWGGWRGLENFFFTDALGGARTHCCCGGRWPAGVYAGDVGEYAGDVGEYAGEVGEYAGDVGE